MQMLTSVPWILTTATRMPFVPTQTGRFPVPVGQVTLETEYHVGVGCFFFERALLIHRCKTKEMWGDGCRFTRRDGMYEPKGRLICNLGLYCCP